MKNRNLFLAIVLLAFSSVQAQNKCEDIAGFKYDLCYENPLIPNANAQFQIGADYFYYKGINAKKSEKIAFSSQAPLEFLLKLTDEKSLHLDAKDVLFIQEAIKTWDKYALDILVKKVTANKRKAEDLATLALTDRLPSGLGIQILDKGKGKAPEAMKKVKVHYRGYLADGTVFDASYDRGQAFDFFLGRGQVIKGWDEGIAKLHVGDHAILRIPAELGYGLRAMGAIPSNAELIFEVILMDAE